MSIWYAKSAGHLAASRVSHLPLHPVRVRIRSLQLWRVLFSGQSITEASARRESKAAGQQLLPPSRPAPRRSPETGVALDFKVCRDRVVSLCQLCYQRGPLRRACSGHLGNLRTLRSSVPHPEARREGSAQSGPVPRAGAPTSSLLLCRRLGSLLGHDTGPRIVGVFDRSGRVVDRLEPRCPKHDQRDRNRHGRTNQNQKTLGPWLTLPLPCEYPPDTMKIPVALEAIHAARQSPGGW